MVGGKSGRSERKGPLRIFRSTFKFVWQVGILGPSRRFSWVTDYERTGNTLEPDLGPFLQVVQGHLTYKKTHPPRTLP